MKIRITSGIRFVNVGEDSPKAKVKADWVGRRQWSACIEYNFLSAGQGVKYSQPLFNLHQGDIVAAYISGYGYVGIGTVEEEAIPIKNFNFQGKTFPELSIDLGYLSGELASNETVNELPFLRKTLFRNADNDRCEYVVRINWHKTVDRNNAYWKRKSGLFANPSIQSSLQNQQTTIEFLEHSFGVAFLK